MRVFSLIMCFILVVPVGGVLDYFPSVANTVLKMRGGASLSGVDVLAVSQLEQQVKRVIQADPAQDLAMSSVRAMTDQDLLRVLLLAVIGNFTSAQGNSWNQPCTLVVDPKTGQVEIQEQPVLAGIALKVIVVILIAVQIRQWVWDSSTTPVADHAKHN